MDLFRSAASTVAHLSRRSCDPGLRPRWALDATCLYESAFVSIRQWSFAALLVSERVHRIHPRRPSCGYVPGDDRDDAQSHGNGSEDHRIGDAHAEDHRV